MAELYQHTLEWQQGEGDCHSWHNFKPECTSTSLLEPQSKIGFRNPINQEMSARHLQYGVVYSMLVVVEV